MVKVTIEKEDLQKFRELVDHWFAQLHLTDPAEYEERKVFDREEFIEESFRLLGIE